MTAPAVAGKTGDRSGDWTARGPVALRLALRELRGGLAGFRVFVIALALGVAAISAVGSFSESVLAGLAAGARELLGGDADVRNASLPIVPEQRAHLAASAQALSEAVELRTMAAAEGRPLERALVELKAVDGAYPLVGRLALDPPLAVDDALRARNGRFGAALDSAVIERLGLRLGDRIRVGSASFEVRARVVREPDRVASVVAFGPRVMISAAALAETGLIQPGSRVHYHYRVRLAAGADPGQWMAELRARFPDAGWRVRGLDDAAPGVDRFVKRIGLFLSFAGMTVLLIGGFGVANGVASFLDSRMVAIATLKCLGASARLIFAVYLIQVGAMTAIAIALGLLAGAALPGAALDLLGPLLPVPPVAGVYLRPLALAAGFGALVALAFSIWPLARACAVAPGALFRAAVAPTLSRPRPWAYGASGALALALAALAVATATERGFALWFVGGTVATLALLRLGASVVSRLAARFAATPGRSAGWRLALANLHRPGNPTAAIAVSLGAGLAVLAAAAVIEGNLSRALGERLPEQAPSFFFVDIQPDQAAAFDAALAAVPGTSEIKRVPSLRGQIVRIAGRPVDEAKIDGDVRWAVRGDRALTYAAAPPEDARLVAGRWWPKDYAGPPLISFDARVARGFGVGVGDPLTLNVLGREITATIASLREIDWRSLRFDFAIVFAPGALEGAPHGHIAAARVPREREVAVERLMATRFPNVSVVRVREALEAAARLLDGIGAAARAAAAVTVLAGALVLAGAVAATRRRRRYDAVVLKVLGATRRRLLGVQAREFAVLGLATAAVAALAGSAIAWAVVAILMDLSWTPQPAALAAAILAGIAVTLAAGLAATGRALGARPAPLLRNE